MRFCIPVTVLTGYLEMPPNNAIDDDIYSTPLRAPSNACHRGC